MNVGKNGQLLVAFGANLPFDGAGPAETILKSVAALSGEGLQLFALSRFFATPCFPAGAGPDYVNAAALLTCSEDVDLTSILARLHAVEARFGRERAQRWGMRTLDIDLLAVGDSVLPDAETQDRWRLLPPEAQVRTTPDRLILPHPRLQDRAFVLVPLADVAPDWVHPRTGLGVLQMLDALPPEDRAAVKPL
ncbi:2-amino-4-hydroxy-6-hydroxymethyldihydropteridine diphosphokinase [Tabrizicola caldifontis]|uniref:2-amino-4-hydroxy-6- hydroxymethyldihydropteridine diphosphokinase n=1 Tax=Tabrizicola caldifontis TaxID=2528036 RepID=UPI001F0EB5C7|nr:2-amino-4-hydroxy-6-hydroxymethyldihydropteridine diphosphokinase [Rhodobacter sp. YIM 73028]